MTTTKFVQCKMRKLIPGQGHSFLVTTSWIPEKFARKGRWVKLRSEDGTWEDGWQVDEAGTVFMDEKEVTARCMDYTHTRKASDI